MYRCQVTNKLSEPGIKAYKVVTKTRPKTYRNVVKQGEKDVEIISHGWEIVEEQLVCKEVYEKLTGDKNESN